MSLLTGTWLLEKGYIYDPNGHDFLDSLSQLEAYFLLYRFYYTPDPYISTSIMKVLISGDGIAGNTLAFWLSKQGHSVTIVERFPSLRASGLQIDLRGHGIEVMRRMGLEEAFRAKCVHEEGFEILDDTGRRRAFFPTNRSGKGTQSFSSDFEIMRGDLCRLIHDATKDNVQYIFGTSIESFDNRSNGVEVLFSDGKRDQFDLLVGADGQGSQTRKMMFGSGTEDGFRPFGNLYMGYFTTPKPMEEGEKYIASAYVVPGGRFIMSRRHNPLEKQVYLAAGKDSGRLNSIRRGDVNEEKKVMEDIFQNAGWQTDWILKSLRESKDFYCERQGFVKLESWSRGRVSLVGDAAYSSGASTGMGTTSAIVGAYILAGEISKHCGSAGKEGAEGIPAALEAYEQTFRPFTKEVQKGLSEESGFLKWIPTTRFGISMMNYFAGMVSFLRLNVIGEWMLGEDVGSWELPGYEEMEQSNK